MTLPRQGLNCIVHWRGRSWKVAGRMARGSDLSPLSSWLAPAVTKVPLQCAGSLTHHFSDSSRFTEMAKKSREARELVEGHAAVRDRMWLGCGLPSEPVPFNRTLYHTIPHRPPHPQPVALKGRHHPKPRNYWHEWLLGKGESIFFSGVATNRLPMLQ